MIKIHYLLRKNEKLIIWPELLKNLILEHGFNYHNLEEALEQFQEFEDEQVQELLIKTKNWNFSEIICSIMAVSFKNRELTIRHLDCIFHFLFFSEDLEISNTVLSFLQINNFFNQINKEILFTGAIQALCARTIFELSEKRLSNGLSFLKIEDLEKTN